MRSRVQVPTLAAKSSGQSCRKAFKESLNIRGSPYRSAWAKLNRFREAPLFDTLPPGSARDRNYGNDRWGSFRISYDLGKSDKAGFGESISVDSVHYDHLRTYFSEVVFYAYEITFCRLT